MQRRFIAAIAAVVFAGLGATLLYTWVNSAEKRALEAAQPLAVLVATREIPAGTPASEVLAFTEVKEIPTVAVVPNALTLDTMSTIDGQETTSDILAGEQVSGPRFGKPGTNSEGEVKTPDGLQQISIQLDASRVSGAQAGDKVSLFYSMQGDDETSRILDDVLVTKVERENEEANSGSVLLTLAVSAKDAARLVFAVDYGSTYISVDPKTGGSSADIKIKKP